VVLGAGLCAAREWLRAEAHAVPWEGAILPAMTGVGGGLLVLAVAGFLLRGRFSALLADGARDAAGPRGPAAALFLVSFVALFVEVMLIRYCGSQLRIFAFFKNVPLLASFLGLGLGCCISAGRPRHALLFLLWLVPFAAFVAVGSSAIDGALGRWAATGSSEHILGDVVVKEAEAEEVLSSQLYIAGFCTLTFLAIAVLFTLLGRLLGQAFEGLPRLAAYGWNIAGSLAGILGFVLLSFLETPPWVWFAVGLAPVVLLCDTPARRAAAALLALASILAVTPQASGTVWSRYQKLVLQEVESPRKGDEPVSPAYRIQISDVFYQVAMDLRPENVLRMGGDPLPHYREMFRSLPAPPERVLVVGAGSGNDVAAALRAGATHVDAVDIDPAIVELGRRYHPERPYDDPRVRVVVDDARAAFRRMPPGSYDAVVFGLLDSHTQLGMSSVRLDNYVFTLESFAAARRLLKPGGRLILAAAAFRDWFRERLRTMTRATCDGPITALKSGTWQIYIGAVNDPLQPPTRVPPEELERLPTDDWPFLYLPEHGVPRAYLLVIGALALTSVLVLRGRGIRLANLRPDLGHVFFLGAAFLLLEVTAINRLALLFGTTWVVSAVAIALVLVLIVLANASVALVGPFPYALSYAALGGSLLLGYALEPAVMLGKGLGWSLAYGFLLLLPVYFAGTIFSRSFAGSPDAGRAMGFNILGAVLGGWLEYVTMHTGIRSLLLYALALYGLSALCLALARRRAVEPREVLAGAAVPTADP
jgi:SAM-dependent methyltransferase